LHLHNAHIDANDEEGHCLPDLEAARECAMKGIRGFLGHEAMEGRLDIRGQIDITDEDGQLLETVRFRDALTIIGL
jgi:hypothetical protein